MCFNIQKVDVNVVKHDRNISNESVRKQTHHGSIFHKTTVNIQNVRHDSPQFTPYLDLVFGEE